MPRITIRASHDFPLQSLDKTQLYRVIETRLFPLNFIPRFRGQNSCFGAICLLEKVKKKADPFPTSKSTFKHKVQTHSLDLAFPPGPKHS